MSGSPAAGESEAHGLLHPVERGELVRLAGVGAKPRDRVKGQVVPAVRVGEVGTPEPGSRPAEPVESRCPWGYSSSLGAPSLRILGMWRRTLSMRP